MLVESKLVIHFVLAIWFLLHHVVARVTLSFLSSILSLRFVLNIKRHYQVFNQYRMCLMFESCGKVPP
jgi:hypothetical protein